MKKNNVRPSERHYGRTRHYQSWQIKVYRQRLADMVVGPDGPRLREYPRQHVATLGPYLVKDRGELHEFCKQFAYANRAMGRYDWQFESLFLENVSRKTVEDLARDNQLTPDKPTA